MSAEAATTPPYLVVIDPGHGGSDHGAIYRAQGKALTEKEVTLELGKALVAHLRQKKIQAILTRSADRDLSLEERTAIANRLKANLFLSLHANSGGQHRPDANGIETYILNTSTNASSKRLADLENSVLGGSIAENEPDAHVSLIIKDMILDANLPQSKKLACAIQNSLISTPYSSGRARDRGVRQALFHVLLGADMPSALIEAGFIHHSTDRQRIATTTGQQTMAAAIANGIDRYRRESSRENLANCRIR